MRLHRASVTRFTITITIACESVISPRFIIRSFKSKTHCSVLENDLCHTGLAEHVSSPTLTQLNIRICKTDNARAIAIYAFMCNLIKLLSRLYLCSFMYVYH